MRNFRYGVLLLLVVLLACGAALAQDPGIRDTVRVAKVNTNAGLKVGVPVTCFNDENLAAYSLGFKWNSVDVTADSVNYAGTRLPAITQKFLAINNINRTILVGMTDFTAVNPLTPGDGLVFIMWFSVSPSAADQFVELDSTFVPPAGKFILSPQSGPSIKPEFIKGQIKIGNPQPPPVIVLSQSSFTFHALVGGGNPTSQVQQITNGGGQTLNWTATKSSTWLVLNPMSGTAPSVMVVAANIIGLPAGTYVDTARITAPGATNSPQIFIDSLILTVPPPTIKLTPDSFYFQALQNGSNPPGQVMNITNIGQGTLNWTATKYTTWLSLSSYSGTAPSGVTLTVDNTGLLPGVYRDSILVSDTTATNDPRYAKVRFEVFSAFPVIDPFPDSVFVVGSGSQDPYPRIFEIRNNGGGVMSWHVTKTKPWLSFDHDTGSAIQGSPGLVTLSFDRNQVPDFGKQVDTITITSPNAINSPVKVKVTFWKMEVPQKLNVSANSLAFTEVECGSYPGVGPKTFNVYPNVPTPPLNWTATHNAPWCTVAPISAPNQATVSVGVNVAGLTPGVYKDTVVVSSEVSITPPEKVVITFTVTSTPASHLLAFSADSLFYLFKYTQVGSSEQSIVVYNQAGGCIDWQATSVPWLTPIPTSGTTKQEVIIRADAVNLSLGRHAADVVFTSSMASNSPKNFPVVVWVYTFGDANGDGIVDISDVVYDVEYIFHGGPAPIPVFWTGDANCDRRTDISDCVWLIDFIFNGGPPPCLY